MSEGIAAPDSPATGSTAPDQSLFSNYPTDPRFFDEMFAADSAGVQSPIRSIDH